MRFTGEKPSLWIKPRDDNDDAVILCLDIEKSVEIREPQWSFDRRSHTEVEVKAKPARSRRFIFTEATF